MSHLPVVLFDADCGFCTRSAGWLTTQWFAARVDLQPLQTADLDELGLQFDDVVALMHAIEPDGRVQIGHRAWASILRHSRMPWPLVGRLLVVPGVSWLASRIYGWVAANRQRLPGGTPACSLQDRPR